MRILMIGRGVIATIYGLALQTAGHHVEFLVRPGRAAELGDTVTMELVDRRRDRHRGSSPRVQRIRLRESLDADDAFDLVILSVSHDALAAAARSLAPRIGDATVLVFGNVWDEPHAAVAPLALDRVVFGFPQAGGGFHEDGVLHGALLRSVVVGVAGRSPSPRESLVQSAFRQAGIVVRQERDFRGWLLLHFISDVGMHAQALRRGGMPGMIGDRNAFRDALLIGRELLPVIRARGVELGRHRVAALALRAPGPTAVVMAWATARFPIAQVSLASHTDPYSAEAVATLKDGVRAARQLGVATPRLDAALREGGIDQE